jgi:hypothetical protein
VDLTPESLAVRGGSNRDVDSLMEKIEDAVADGFGPVLSIFCGTPVAPEGASRSHE